MTDTRRSRPATSASEPCPLGTRWAAWKNYVLMWDGAGASKI